MDHSYFDNQVSADTIGAAIEGFGVWLEIDLDAISANLRQIRSRVGDNAEVMPVIKNDAYGHGLLPIAAHLQDQGCRRLMVAKLWEAFALNTALP
ncbi:MAG: alanine racemase, partial [Gammaproteobacteria bacterium]|nr:alanine racemase [Gammaproteobacteria bacterium]